MRPSETRDPLAQASRRRGVVLLLVVLAAGAATFLTHLTLDAQEPRGQQQSGDRPFRHAEHEQIACERCHRSAEEHGRLTVTTRRECLSCHHAPEQRARCVDCHDTALSDYPYPAAQSFQVAGAAARQGTLTFQHDEHSEVPCATCHVEPLTLSARGVSCESCHEEHHAPNAECVRCHIEAPDAAHPRASHVTCTGAGCHDVQRFLEQPRRRNLCLACHQELADHKPGGNCVDCHVLPPWHPDSSARRDDL